MLVENRYNLVAENPQSTVVAEYTPQRERAEQYQGEAQLEQAFIEQLQAQAYEYPVWCTDVTVASPTGSDRKVAPF